MNAVVKSRKSEGAESEERVKEKYFLKKDKLLAKRTAKRVRTW